VSASDGTVLVGAGAGVFYLGFDLPRATGGTWAGHPSFPRFWANVVERARERPEHPSELVVHPTGIELVLPRPASAGPRTPLRVDGVPASGGRFVPLEVGVHRVRSEGGTDETRFAAGLFDLEESDLRGAKERPFTEAELAPFRERSDQPERVALGGAFASVGLALALAAWGLSAARRG
jgi:hypothetical protein